jgi:hypothetical protein
MNITFYNVSDSPKKLEKNLSNVIGTARALAPTGQINVLNPVVVVAWDAVNGDKVINANYAYIDTFKRYYFITCGIDTAQRIIVSGKVDYLMSWANGIKHCPCTVVRAELGKPTDVKDTKYPIQPDKYIIQGVDFDESLYLRDAGFSPVTVIVTR